MKMKRILSSIIAVCLMLSSFGFTAFASDEVSKWDGETVTTEWYDNNKDAKEFVLKSASDLAGLSSILWNWDVGPSNNPFQGCTIKLAVDVDLAGYEWRPIGFAKNAYGLEKGKWFGSFDGQGHTISNLKVTGNYPHSGLFGYTGGGAQTIKDLTIENVYITNNSTNKLATGALVGRICSDAFVVSNVDVMGTIKLQGEQFVGGIAGYGRGKIENCNVEGSGSISATDNDAGGLVGIYYANNENTYITGSSVIGDAENGGLKISAGTGLVGGAVGCASPEANAGEKVIDQITVSNVALDAGSTNKASYVAYGYAATNSKASDVTAKNDEGAVTPNDADNIALPVAKIGDTNYFSFNDAYTAAEDGDIIELVDGTYTMPASKSKDITIKGSRNVIIDNVGKYGTHASLTFEGVTIDFMPNVDYTGFQHSNVMTYNNVRIVGQQFLYGEKEIFNNCEFVQESSGAYNVWTYGAKYVEFNNCTFTSAGKSVLVYNENEDGTQLKVVDTDFIATTPVEGKAAIEIDSSLMAAEKGYSITVDGKTTATGFAAGSDSGNTLWNDKRVNAGTSGNTVVIVDDEVVHANVKNADEDTVVVAVVDGKAYTDMTAAIKAIDDNSVMNILAGTYEEKLDITEKNVKVLATGDVKFTTIPKLKGTNWYVEGIDFEYESSYNDINASGTLKDCTFTSDTNTLRSCYGTKDGQLVIDGCTFNTGNPKSYWAIHFDQIYNASVIIKNSTLNGHLALPADINSVTVEDTTINGAYANIWGEKEGISFKNTTFAVNYIFLGYDDALATFDKCKSADGKEIAELIHSDSTEATVIVDGKVETKDAKIVNADGTIDYYKTLTEAVVAANGRTIDLMGNTVAFEYIDSVGDATITNGTITLNPETATFASTEAPHWLVDGDVVFENVTLVGENYNTAGWGLFYFDAEDASVTFVNSSINLKNDAANGGFAKGEDTNEYVIFNNTDGYFENTGRGFTNIKKVTLVNDSDLVFKGTKADGIENAFNMTGLEINDTSSVEIDGCSEYGIKISEDIKVEGEEALLVVRNSGIADIIERDDAAGNPAIRAAGGGRVYADIIDSSVWVVENAGGDIVATANNIWVQFEKDSETEESVTYDIVLSGYKNNINRLTTADLTFDFDPVDVGIYENSNLGYVIVPATGITLTPKGENRYMFNFNGITKPDESGKNIVIGQVTISGFGTYTFKVDDSDEANLTNLVNATEVEDNIVDSFVPGGAENKGTLVLNTVMDGNDNMVETIVGENKIPVRTLTINIDFPNKVNYNAATYQDMTVTVQGGQYSLVENLGSVNKNDTETGYKLVITDLPYNTTYMVTVEGAGYRTARYSVVMTDHKTLNFWNNVKSAHNAMEIEEGVSGDTTKNFLAGDIVKDNAINIWDLNAVVSFFGTDASTDGDKYVRYDLNRDKKIDSKDVAYVLVSWGE